MSALVSPYAGTRQAEVQSDAHSQPNVPKQAKPRAEEATEVSDNRSASSSYMAGLEHEEAEAEISSLNRLSCNNDGKNGTPKP